MELKDYDSAEYRQKIINGGGFERAVFDIETNGFYFEVHTCWCIWVFDVDSEDRIGFRPHQMEEAVRFLNNCNVLIGHNIVDYDIPVMRKLFEDFDPMHLFDTLVLSRMLAPDRFSHSLKSYGKQLDNAKGDYGEQEEAWDKFSEDMYWYCFQDVNLNKDVYYKLCKQADLDPLNPPTMKA